MLLSEYYVVLSSTYRYVYNYFPTSEKDVPFEYLRFVMARPWFLVGWSSLNCRGGYHGRTRDPYTTGLIKHLYGVVIAHWQLMYGVYTTLNIPFITWLILIVVYKLFTDSWFSSRGYTSKIDARVRKILLPVSGRNQKHGKSNKLLI